MYFPTTRVLTVLELLQTHGTMTGAEIAARLEVDIRTARRYVERLQELGIPVEGTRGRYGAYQLRPGYKLPPLLFSEEEALALTLGLHAARRLGLATAAPAIEGTLAKVERVLPDQVRERIQAVEDTLVLDIEHSTAAPPTAIVLTIGSAIRLGRRVSIRYRSARVDDTERAIDPYGLVFRDGYWYAVAYCHLRKGQRLFRLDRIQSATLREATFVRPARFDPREEVRRMLASKPGDWLVEVLLETTLERAQRAVSPTQALLEETEDGVLFRCWTHNLPWMARLLAGLGIPLLVRQPPELRAALHSFACDVARWAERTEAAHRD